MMFPYWTLFKYGIPFLIGAIIAGGAAWKIQGYRLDAAKTELSACANVNQTQIATISSLKDAVVTGDKTCQARLASKDAAIKKLATIDDLTGKRDEKGNVDPSDPILHGLNGMWQDVDKK